MTLQVLRRQDRNACRQMVFSETEKLYQDLSIYLSVEKGKASHDTSPYQPNRFTHASKCYEKQMACINGNKCQYFVSRGHSCKRVATLSPSPSSRCNTNEIKVRVEVEVGVVLGSLTENLEECAPITQHAYNFAPSILIMNKGSPEARIRH